LDSGAHFNPQKVPHGDISATIHHVGDLGNVVSDAFGKVDIDFIAYQVSLYGTNNVYNRSWVLHEKEDDLNISGDPSVDGNSGAPIACGTVAGLVLLSSANNLHNTLVGCAFVFIFSSLFSI
jgi:Cu-Zn family superoxide dismutase